MNPILYVSLVTFAAIFGGLLVGVVLTITDPARLTVGLLAIIGAFGVAFWSIFIVVEEADPDD